MFVRLKANLTKDNWHQCAELSLTEDYCIKILRQTKNRQRQDDWIACHHYTNLFNPGLWFHSTMLYKVLPDTVIC